MATISSDSIWQQIISFRYMRELGIAIIAGAVLVAGYYAYDHYANQKEALANQAFAEGYELYEQSIAATQNEKTTDATKKQMLLSEAEAAFRSGYKQFSGTRLAPYFLAMESEIALKLGNTKNAIELLQKMLASLRKSEPLYGLYATKLALIKIDTEKPEEGLNELNALAHDTGNQSQDFALYSLGEYYWAKGDTAKAQEAWRLLRDIGAAGIRPMPSPWLALVQQRLIS